MSVIKVNNDNFEKEVLQSEKTVLVDFYADWCGPCKMLSPIVDEVAEEIENVKVCKINIDESRDLAGNYDIMSIPTLLVFKNGKVVNSSLGLINKEKVLNLIK